MASPQGHQRPAKDKGEMMGSGHSETVKYKPLRLIISALTLVCQAQSYSLSSRQSPEILELEYAYLPGPLLDGQGLPGEKYVAEAYMALRNPLVCRSD